MRNSISRPYDFDRLLLQTITKKQNAQKFHLHFNIDILKMIA